MPSPVQVEQAALRTASRAMAAHIQRENAFGARNYDPLPVVLGQGAGAWLTDVDGKRYLEEEFQKQQSGLTSQLQGAPICRRPFPIS